MRISVRALTVVAAVVFAATTVAGQKVNPKANVKAVGFPPPYWAYPANDPHYEAPADDGVPRTVPGSNVRLTLTTIREVTTPPDWHPGDHPAMPPVVGNAPKSQVWACGYCHLPVGWGKPENANVANLPEAYFMQQVADYKSGKRRSSIPDIVPHSGMLEAVMNTSDAEIHRAWEYFSKNKLTTQRYKVTEAATVPKSKVQGGWVLYPIVGPGAGTEPIGKRIIEMPVNPELVSLRDWRQTFVTYVPPGSLKRGEDLVKTGGNGRTQKCTICHGEDLRGVGPFPPIAGRSAIYTFRQLYDFKSGTRNGDWSPLMKEVVAKLTLDDMIAITSYTSSQMP